METCRNGVTQQFEERLQRNRRLVLASSFLCVMPILKTMAPRLKGGRAVFIDTASKVEAYGIANRLMRLRLRSLDMRVSVMDVSCTPVAQMNRMLRAADLIYVCGGNTFYLLQQLRASGADRLVKEAVARGTLYVGESAGSVVAGGDIAYIAQMDDSDRAPGMTDYRGLGLVDLAIVPHVGSRFLGRSAQNILEERTTSQMLLALRNYQALVVNGEDMRVLSFPSLLGRLSEQWPTRR